MHGGGEHGQADRAGAEHHYLLAGLADGRGPGVHGHRGGLDEGRAVGVQVADGEDLVRGDLEPFLQAAVEWTPTRRKAGQTFGRPLRQG